MTTQTSQTTLSGPGHTSQTRHCLVVYRSTWNSACWEPNYACHTFWPAREHPWLSFRLLLFSFVKMPVDRASSAVPAECCSAQKRMYSTKAYLLIRRPYFQGHVGFPDKFHETHPGACMAQGAVIDLRAALPAWHSLLRRDGCGRDMGYFVINLEIDVCTLHRKRRNVAWERGMKTCRAYKTASTHVVQPGCALFARDTFSHKVHSFTQMTEPAR